ncbi:1-deoxy-D-xylulose-5-phosphate reductoisomerase [Paroceanicella profunda]|uniref:1-deoxy-D-xylulose 5-phosphate reductoisomerase n=1 Tax=Paroceanicella profunda TaxID=2579971 RepID=A0A5B8FZ86_9RHOB|nr:1-deoxy-D-xylulose-5-phosphate reductoisomerase [Paroceanicella profunda]QDL92740.1 1-deoxy-D-xylulose-5-phosphate reductoisomerase [Paroceanicella profunda]
MHRSVSILGATGSVGSQTVRLLQAQGGAERYRVRALTGNGNIALLADMARALRAEVAVTADLARLAELRAALAGSGTEAAAGPEALVEAASRPVDWTMSSIVGVAGLAPTLAAAARAGTLALANKESLVCAGALLKATVAASGAVLIPADSEHSAIFQVLQGGQGTIARLILTASGGPFRDWDRARMATATPAQAVAHPNWDMGRKISVDSASMFNKALEMIEAHELFTITPDCIDVLVHRQSIVHSLVEFADGVQLAQLGAPDMVGPIGFALNWPERSALPVERLDLAAVGALTFEAPDAERFPALRLARETMRAGGLMGAVFNGAKETALEAFLEGRCGFLDMADHVEHALEQLEGWAARDSAAAGREAVLAADAEARALTAERIRRRVA